VEAGLRDKGNEVEVHVALQQTAQVLQQTMASIQGILEAMPSAQPVEPQPVTEGEWQLLSRLRQEMRVLLQSDDATAADLWETHRALFRADCENPEAIEAAIADFDFDAALKLLEKASAP
jgi:hypothetical protein